ncbi:MAG TPA: Crp/Fnr family transcriptional regulator [Candidatus Obscuribacterales bacterium]
MGPLETLPEEFLQEFNLHKTVRTYRPGQVLFYEHNQPFGVYCIEIGKVKLTKSAADGKNYLTHIAHEGDLLGYRDFLTNEAYSDTAEVLEAATICFITREAFHQALQRYPAFALRMLRELGGELKRSEERARDLAYKSVPERMAGLFLSLEQSFGRLQPDGRILLDIRLSREELASMLGTTVETAVRALTQFKRHKLIDAEKKRIILRDLRKLAEYSPST